MTETIAGPSLDALEALEVYRQLRKAAYIGHLTQIEIDGQALRFTISPFGRDVLMDDRRFLQGPGHLLHDVGDDPIDCRSLTDSFGPGSLQICFDLYTGNAYADVDRANPYEDVVHFTEHNVAEVLWHSIKGWFSRKDRT